MDLTNQMLIATRSSKIDISLEKNTESISKRFSNLIRKGDIIYFYGEIGVGKTTFIKYLINCFQKDNKLKKTEVTSPTFGLLNEYKINQININHYDLFRLKSKKEIRDLDLFEDNSNIITLIEWPELIEIKPKNLIELNFKYEDDYLKRSVKIKGLKV